MTSNSTASLTGGVKGAAKSGAGDKKRGVVQSVSVSDAKADDQLSPALTDIKAATKKRPRLGRLETDLCTL